MISSYTGHLDPIRKIIERDYGEVFVISGNEYKVKCKKCNIKAMWINVEKMLYKCFSCSNKGRADKLIPALKSRNMSHMLIKKAEISSRELKNSILPSNYKRISNIYEFKDGWNYLIKRGINPRAIEWGTYDLLSVCFPLRERGDIVYWQSRKIYEHFKIKIENPPKGVTNFGKEHYVYNIDSLGHYDIAIIVEGIIDAVRVNGLSILGKQMSPYQIRKIIEKRPFIIIIAFDSDARLQTIKTVNDIQKSGYKRCFPVLLKDGDPAEIGFDNFYREIESSLIEDSSNYSRLLKLLGVSFPIFWKLLQEKRSIAELNSLT